MDTLTAWLNSSGTPTVLWVLAVGAAVCLFAYGIAILVASATDPIRRRLTAVAAPARQDTSGRPLDLAWFVNPLAKYLVPKKSNERDSAQTRLIQAGFRSPEALRNFYGIKGVLAIALPVLLLLGSRWAPQLSTNAIFFFAVLLAFVGVRLPDHVLGIFASVASSGCATACPTRSTCSWSAWSRVSAWRLRSSESRESSNSVIPISRWSCRS